MKKQEKEMFGQLQLLEEDLVFDEATLDRIHQKLKERRRRRKFVRSLVSTAAALICMVTAFACLLLLRENPAENNRFQIADLEWRTVASEELSEKFGQKNILLPDSERYLVDFTGARVYYLRETEYAWRAEYLYNFEDAFVLLVTDREEFEYELFDPAGQTKSVERNGIAFELQIADTQTRCACELGGVRYYLTLKTNPKALNPVLDSIFGERA